MKKFEIILMGLIMLALPFKSVWVQAKTGTAGAKFLQVGVSARAVGMGEAFLGIADDASAIFYNSAHLCSPFLNWVEFLDWGYSRWMPEIFCLPIMPTLILIFPADKPLVPKVTRLLSATLAF